MHLFYANTAGLQLYNILNIGMADAKLVNTPIDISCYSTFNPENLPCLFIGFITENEYDSQRLKIDVKYNPEKLIYIYERDKEFKVLPLYGLYLPLNQASTDLTKVLLDREATGRMELETYQYILKQHNLSCDDAFYHFNKHVYPIDFKHFKKLTDDTISHDELILQHLLNMNEDEFDFEKFGAFKVAILI